MKAIICSQCGAAIENVSDTAVIVVCVYCGARSILSPEAKLPTPPRRLPKVNQEFASFAAAENQPADPTWIFTGVIAATLLLPVLIAVFVATTSSNRSETTAAEPTPSPWTSSTPFVPLWGSASNPTLPTIRYQTKVSWTGPINDMEHFDEPTVDLSNVGTTDVDEIRKTIFKDRRVTVRVTINEDGYVATAEALSGHPLLKAASVESAKRSLFSSRSKPTTRVLTYTFRVLND